MITRQVTLTDGRQVTVDLSKISLKEHRSLFTPDQENEDRLLARVAGMSVEDFTALQMADWKLITEVYFWLARNPVFDPNSVSGSTSTSDTDEKRQSN